MSSNEEAQKLIKSKSEHVTVNINNNYGSNDEDTKMKDKETQMKNDPKKDTILEAIRVFAGEDEEEESFLENGEGLDIYQLVAFQRIGGYFSSESKKYKRTHCCGEYGLNVAKALICAFIQISSVVILFFYAIDTVKPASGRDWCDRTGDTKTYVIAIAYTTFLSLILWSNIRNTRRGGFYKYRDRTKHLNLFVCDKWLAFGKFVNNCTILSAFVLSFLIIFFGTDPMDIILNAVALLFIAEIDNMMVSSEDYRDTLKWFKNKPTMEDLDVYKGRDGIWNALFGCVCLVWVCFSFCWNCLQFIVDGCAYVFAIFIPIFVIACY